MPDPHLDSFQAPVVFPAALSCSETLSLATLASLHQSPEAWSQLPTSGCYWAETGNRHRRVGMQRKKCTDTNRKQGLVARWFFASFFMKLNVVSGVVVRDYVLLNPHGPEGLLSTWHPQARPWMHWPVPLLRVGCGLPSSPHAY